MAHHSNLRLEVSLFLFYYFAFSTRPLIFVGGGGWRENLTREEDCSDGVILLLSAYKVLSCATLAKIYLNHIFTIYDAKGTLCV
jgi:hypothetical protein